MRYFNNIDEFDKNKGSVVTVGKFEGLHNGHRTLFNAVINEAKENNLTSFVYTFDDEIFNGAKILFTDAEKKMIYESIGIDNVYIRSFDDDFKHKEPTEFVRELVFDFNMKAFVCGSDFKFGKERLGDTKLLSNLSSEYGFKLIVLNKETEDDEIISSTKIKSLLEKGELLKANKLLGFPFFYMGEVVNGVKLARNLGFPTANVALQKEKLSVPFGVYCSKIEFENNCFYGMTNIGVKPTVTDSDKVLIETYIDKFNGDLYGKTIKISLLDFIRPEKKFDSVEELKTQVEADLLRIYYRNLTE